MDIDPVFGWGSTDTLTATPTIFENGTLKYDVERGSAETPEICQSQLDEAWCHDMNATNLMFWYNTTIFVNMTQLDESFWRINVNTTQCSFNGKPRVILTLPFDTLNYTNGLTAISSADGSEASSYVWIRNVSLEQHTDAVVDDVWSESVCASFVTSYCAYVDVPPYSCKRKVFKSVLESLSLSASFTNTMYSVLVIFLGIVFRCIGNHLREDESTNPVMTEMLMSSR